LETGSLRGTAIVRHGDLDGKDVAMQGCVIDFGRRDD
jgi:hypothetical protein